MNGNYLADNTNNRLKRKNWEKTKKRRFEREFNNNNKTNDNRVIKTENKKFKKSYANDKKDNTKNEISFSFNGFENQFTSTHGSSGSAISKDSCKNEMYIDKSSKELEELGTRLKVEQELKIKMIEKEISIKKLKNDLNEKYEQLSQLKSEYEKIKSMNIQSILLISKGDDDSDDNACINEENVTKDSNDKLYEESAEDEFEPDSDVEFIHEEIELNSSCNESTESSEKEESSKEDVSLKNGEKDKLAKSKEHLNDITKKVSNEDNNSANNVLNVPEIGEIDNSIRVAVNTNCSATKVIPVSHPIQPLLSTISICKDKSISITDVKMYYHRLFVCGSLGLLRQYNLETQEVVKDYFGHRNLVHCMLIIPSASGVSKIYSAGYDCKLLIHDVNSGKQIASISTKHPVICMCVNNRFLYYGTTKGTIGIVDLEVDAFRTEICRPECGIACMVSVLENNDFLLFIGTMDGKVKIYDGITLNVRKEVSLPRTINNAPIGLIHLVQHRLVIYDKTHVHFLYYKSDRAPVTYNHLTKNNSMCMAKDFMIIGHNDGQISYYPLKGSTVRKIALQRYSNSDSPVLSVTFYNDVVISGTKDGSIFFNKLPTISKSTPPSVP